LLDLFEVLVSEQLVDRHVVVAVAEMGRFAKAFSGACAPSNSGDVQRFASSQSCFNGRGEGKLNAGCKASWISYSF
jgi:hypothetical protein